MESRSLPKAGPSSSAVHITEADWIGEGHPLVNAKTPVPSLADLQGSHTAVRVASQWASEPLLSRNVKVRSMLSTLPIQPW